MRRANQSRGMPARPPALLGADQKIASASAFFAHLSASRIGPPPALVAQFLRRAWVLSRGPLCENNFHFKREMLFYLYRTEKFGRSKIKIGELQMDERMALKKLFVTTFCIMH